MQEKVYIIDNLENTSKILDSFLDELYSRRRYDSSEGGIQAAGIILPDKSGFKITEDDGLEPHQIANINLFRFLNGRTDFMARTRNFNQIINGTREIINSNCVEVRITASNDDLLLAFNSSSKTISSNSTQLKIILSLFEKCLELKNKGMFSSIRLGAFVGDLEIGFDEEIEDGIKKLKEKINILGFIESRKKRSSTKK